MSAGATKTDSEQPIDYVTESVVATPEQEPIGIFRSIGAYLLRALKFLVYDPLEPEETVEEWKDRQW